MPGSGIAPRPGSLVPACYSLIRAIRAECSGLGGWQSARTGVSGGYSMNRRGDRGARELRELASLSGVQLSYIDILSRRRRTATVNSLLAVLRALGHPVEKLKDAPVALREYKQADWRELTEPVSVARKGKARLTLRLSSKAASRLHFSLILEDGTKHQWSAEPADLTLLIAEESEGEQFRKCQLEIPVELPPGYHRLTVERAGNQSEVLLLSPPSAGAYLPRGRHAARTWGVFLPLYALHSDRSWGCGDFTDLDALMDWVSQLGGGVVATLPFLAAFLDAPFEPSPYAPVSRLFWNELFLDVTSIPELKQSVAAQDLIGSTAVQDERQALQQAPRVDYRRAMALKRRILEELARALFTSAGERRTELEQFVGSHPILQDYSRFRAVCDRRGTAWPAWQARQREGELRESDYELDTQRYHLYVQWLAHQQLHAFAAKARRHGPGLYLDLPLGVHPDGYDAWRFRDTFADGVSGGAPPDNFFTKGQNWGFHPLHPERIRRQEYHYFIHCLRHHLRYAGILRIDHIMGLHRLFWVPQGRKAIEGVYVRYRAEELYAILALESQRHSALLVGEDLGTVPPAVRPMMARHRILQSYVAQFEISSYPRPRLNLPRRNSLASLNTHDTPTFTGFWEGLDIEDRVSLGLLTPAEAQNEQENRRRLKEVLRSYLTEKEAVTGGETDALAVVRACLRHLAASSARVVSVNLEDLWGEREPQNVPGTTRERPNWIRKGKLSLENFCNDDAILATLRDVHSRRKSKRKME